MTQCVSTGRVRRSHPLCIVAPTPRIASAFVVHCGRYGDVLRLAGQRGVCRQRLYRQAHSVLAAIEGRRPRQTIDDLRQRLRDREQRLAHVQRRQDDTVVVDRDKQAEFATVGQARGVSLTDWHALLDVLLPGRAPSVATLGRWTQDAARRAAGLLAVLDDKARPLVRQALADALYVKQPVLMVEPDSLCWVSGRRLESLSGDRWTEELARLPNLEQVTRDAGSCLSKGVAQLNRQRQQAGQPTLADQVDHFHVLREGGRGVGRAERAAQRAQLALVKAEAERAKRQRQEQPLTGLSNRIRARRVRANQALEAWIECARLWQQAREAVQPFSPQGELTTRPRAEALLAQTLPLLPDKDFRAAERPWQRPQTLTCLDEVQRKLAALPVPAEVREAAVRQEGLRRRPELLRGDGLPAAAWRGVLLLCAVVLAKAGSAGEQAVRAVRSILRSHGRASSLVECVKSVVRMWQSRHRKLSQGLLDLKRLYGNSHVFRTGRRRQQSPYQRLGVPWPQGVRWWEVLQWTPERLRDELSAQRKVA